MSHGQPVEAGGGGEEGKLVRTYLKEQAGCGGMKNARLYLKNN
jgi:hypothetical protein